MNDLLSEIENIERTITLVDKDVEYLATAYLSQETNFELPMADMDTVVEIDYSTLFKMVKTRIEKLSGPNGYIVDSLELMGYIDYYFQFVSPSSCPTKDNHVIDENAHSISIESKILKDLIEEGHLFLY